MLLSIIRKVDLVGKFYSSNLGKKWIQNKLKSVLPHLSATQKVLDIGSGNGMITHHLRKKNINTTPVDVANLSILPDVQSIVYDGVHMPFEANSFDTGLLLTVLHHCPDPDIVLQEAARVSQKLVIIEDVYSNPIQQYMTYAMDTLVNFGHSSMTYQNRSDKEWKTTFDRMGFKLVEESSKSVLLFFRQATYVLETSP